MAWIRTATSLITFGFALYKFFFYLREAEHVNFPEQMLGPRSYGLIMIGIGIFTLAIATMQHRAAVKALRRQHEAIPTSLATIVAGLIAILGILAFATAVFRE
jgi:putative membrane protein